MSEYVVELKNATKRFPGVVALKNMQLSVKPGEILGLIGENGAGKSTLIKVLTGVHQADEGQIYVDVVEQHFKDPNDSAAAGIACVYQELNIEKLLSITDNIFINKWIKKGTLLDYPTMHKKAKEVMASLGQDVDPTKPAGNFGMGVQQMIEIAKAVLINAKMIIMDEPTSSLGEKEVEQLMKTCRDLKARGIGIVFVSHKLEELFELCDRVEVIRDGEFIATKPIEVYRLLGEIKSLYLRYRGTTHLKCFLKNAEGEQGCYLKFKSYDMEIRYLPQQVGMPTAAGAVFELDENNFLIVGMMCNVCVHTKPGDHRKVDFIRKEAGTYSDGQWRCRQRQNGDEKIVTMLYDMPECVKMELFKY